MTNVITDINVLRTPASDLAKRLAAAAVVTSEKAGDGGVKGIATSRSNLFHVNPYNLHVEDGWNARDLSDPENAQHVDDTARSIAKVGVKRPLKGYLRKADNKLVVTDGHVRLAAVFRAIEVYGAEVVSVPFITEPTSASAQDRLLTQIVDNSGKPLTALEQGRVFKKMTDLGASVEQIAERVNLGVQWISQLLELQAAPDEVKAMISQGKVAATTAWKVVKDSKTDEEAISKLRQGLEVAASRGRTRATAKHIDSDKPAAKDAKKVLREVITDAKKVDDETGIFQVNLTSEQYELLCKFLNV